MRRLAWTAARHASPNLYPIGIYHGHRHMKEPRNYDPRQMGLPLIEDPSVPLEVFPALDYPLPAIASAVRSLIRRGWNSKKALVGAGSPACRGATE
jgi:hypothetical protein